MGKRGKFALWSKELKDWETIYDIRYNKSGYPTFLVWREGKWMCRSAKYFTPRDPWDLEMNQGS